MRLTTVQSLQLNPSDAPHFISAQGETLQIDILKHDLIRVRMMPNGEMRFNRTWMIMDGDGTMPQEGRQRDDLSPFPMPSYRLTEHENEVTIETDTLRIVVDQFDGSLTWFDANGQRFAADLKHRAYTYDRTGRTLFHYLERRSDEFYYGFGERSGDLEKTGRRMRSMAVDGLGYSARTSDPLYKNIPFYITFLPEMQIAYGLFYDNLSGGAFDLGNEIDAFWGPYRYFSAEDGDLDYYLLYGPSIEAVIEQFTELTGRPTLLPRWSLGYLGSTMSYTEAPDAQEQLKRFAELCQQHDIPCDAFHLSSGYTTDAQGRRNVFTWNRDRIPDPKQMVDTFHAAGIHVAPNIKPWLLAIHPEYESLREAGGFLRDPETGEAVLCRLWSGGEAQSSVGAYVDFSSEVGYAWWQQHIRSALFEYGIDAVWNDNNEYGLWDDEAVCAGFGSPFRLGLGRPLQTLFMARAAYEASLEYYPTRRPFILSRSGCPGIQRYAQTWTGDNTTSWETLRYNIPMGLGLGLSGVPNIGHDVGGFAGPAPEPELFVRWVQNGIFHPRFTIHSWNSDGTVNEPWMHPEVLPIVREMIHFRYKLIPYLYTLMTEAHHMGHPIIRPLVYHFPDDPNCHTESFDFLLGSHLLVASVLEPGARTRRVYLPQGTWWCDFYTGTWYEGGQTIEVDAPLERIPLFVADGGIIPMGAVMRYVGEQVEDVRDIYIFARGEARFTLIEDDGETLMYYAGAFTAVQFSLDWDGDELVARAECQHNGYPLPYRDVTFIVATDADHGPRGSTLVDGRWRVLVPVV